MKKNSIDNVNDRFKMQVALLPSNFLENAEYFNFPHPRNGKTATFLMKDDLFYELLYVDRPHSSWFIGNSVVSDGVPLFAVPIHPLLIVLPFVSSRGKEMFSENDFFFDTKYASIANQLKPKLKLICQQNEIADDLAYYYDQDKAVSWIVSKTEQLMPFFRQSDDTSEQVKNEDHFLIEVCFDAVRHYLSNDFAQLVKDELRKKYPGSFPPKELNSSDSQTIVEAQQPQKNKKKTPASKLKKPAGNMSISSFFAPVKSKE